MRLLLLIIFLLGLYLAIGHEDYWVGIPCILFGGIGVFGIIVELPSYININRKPKNKGSS